ncbi:MAG: Rossmann-like and DUF2520 domain-containing protein [Bacteroidales bacterium]
MSEHIKSISFLGAGNVATHLARAFYSTGYTIAGIYSPGMISASVLAAEVSAWVCKTIQELSEQAELIIVSVPDHAFAEVLESLSSSTKFIVHTSGGLDLAAMRGKVARFGVLYPLQTFSKNTEVSLKKVPFCIEASDKKLQAELHLLASSVSDTVLDINSAQRRILHLSAVFACNFPNCLYAIAANLLKNADLSFELLHPLILETAHKVTVHHPLESQTGPAYRGDIATMKEHEAMLSNSESYRQIYDLLSKAIQEQLMKNEV